MVTLWVAPEVGSKEFVPALRRVGIDAQLAKLDSADFAFTGNGPEGSVEIGIERKALSDLTTCLRDGRFAGMPTEHGKGGQLHRLKATYDYVWLLVEGRWVTDASGRIYAQGRRSKHLLPGGFTEDSLAKQLISIEVEGEVGVHQTSGKVQTTSWLASMFRWWTDKAWHQHTTLKVAHQRHGMVPLSCFREMTMPLPGVGLAGSLALEKQFSGSLSQLLTATMAQLSNVQTRDKNGPRRLGESRATQLRAALDKLQ